MLEHILLYLLAHMVSSLVAAYMLWKWFPEIANPWLKSGVVCLQLGFASGLAFDAAKLTAISARWAHTDWDGLSTRAAPPFALLEGILVAIGFIVPQAGPFLQKWSRVRREYSRLRPLWRSVQNLAPAAATARFGPWAPLELRLVQRQQRIHDALRLLAPYLDSDLYQRARQAVPAGQPEGQEQGIAGAVTLHVALDAHHNGSPCPASAQDRQLGTDLHGHLDAISTALRRPHLVDSVRQRVTGNTCVP